MDVSTMLHSVIMKGVLSGVASAAAVDFQAFRTFQSLHDAATYGWGVAAWRWFQGGVVGGVTAAGVTGLIG